MFDLGWQELLIIAIVTLIVVGPKDLPKLFNKAGRLVGNIKQISREFFDKVNEAAEVEEIKNLKTSINEIGDFDSYQDNNLTVELDSKNTVKKKTPTTGKKVIKKKTPTTGKKVIKKKTKTS